MSFCWGVGGWVVSVCVCVVCLWCVWYFSVYVCVWCGWFGHLLVLCIDPCSCFNGTRITSLSQGPLMALSGYVGMSWLCHSGVMVMSWWCHGDVMVMSWWCPSFMGPSIYIGKGTVFYQSDVVTTNYSRFCETTTQEQYNNLKAVFIRLCMNSLLKTFINKWHQESQLSSNGRIYVKAAIFFCCWWGISGEGFHDAGFSAEEAICGQWSFLRGLRQIPFFNS